MTKADIWMPLFIGSYLADTTRLTTEQHGAYLLLIMDYWRSGPPPDDDLILANVARCTLGNWKKIRVALEGFFEIKNERWVHGKIEKELDNARKNKEKAELKAAKAAESRWSKPPVSDTSSNAPSNAPSIPKSMLEDMHEECPLPSPLPITSKTRSKTESALATRLPPDWEPNDIEVQFCKTERQDLQVATVAARFRDYWIAQPGLKGRKTDWTATWRNWVRNEKGQQARASALLYKTATDKSRDIADALTGKTRNEQATFIDIN